MTRGEQPLAPVSRRQIQTETSAPDPLVNLRTRREIVEAAEDLHKIRAIAEDERGRITLRTLGAGGGGIVP